MNVNRLHRPDWATPPNIVLIIVDTLRADHLGCYGMPLPLTPHMDSLAHRGVLFSNVLSAAPSTGASHASIMTGCYPTAHGVTLNPGAIPQRLTSFAQVCRSLGYETAAFVSNPVLRSDYLRGIDRGFDLYDEDLPRWEDSLSLPYRDAAETAAAVSGWLDAKRSEPFFVWAHFFEPHGPYRVRDDTLLQRVAGLPRHEGEPAELPVLDSYFGSGGIPPFQVLGAEREPARYRARYAARTAYVDRYVGQVFDVLRETGREENTLVILTSDHGELLGEHNHYFQHQITVFEPVLRVPLIFAAPRIGDRLRIPSRVSTTDIMPTMLDYIGVEPRQHAPLIQGRSLIGSLIGFKPPAPTPRYAVCKMHRKWCVAHGCYKYILSEDGSGTLFDLLTDPEEHRDASSQWPDLAAGLRKAAFAFAQTAPHLFDSDQEPAQADEEYRRQLAALGYVD
jgi:arylsulfatase